MTREEAIKRIREWNLDTDDMEVLSAAIPELTENEDERIRKEIVECIETLIKQPGASPRLCDWLAWLEKQKEQKPAVEQQGGTFNSYDMAKTFAEGQYYVMKHPEKFCLCKPVEWSKEDEKMLLSIINAFRNGTVSTIGQEQWLKSLHERFNLKPKQGWGEEDENKLHQVMEILLADKTIALRENPRCKALYRAYDELLDWFKSLPERFSLQPKQEWNEEDERRFISCMGRLQTADGAPTNNSDWFEEHCYKHPSWKPSEEQMNALKNAGFGSLENGDKPYLRGLYDDIKTLM